MLMSAVYKFHASMYCVWALCKMFLVKFISQMISKRDFPSKSMSFALKLCLPNLHFLSTRKEFSSEGPEETQQGKM